MVRGAGDGDQNENLIGSSLDMLRMVAGDHRQIGGGGVGGELGDILAAGDDARDGRVLQAPGQGPRRHRHAGGNFRSDLLDLGEQAIDEFGGVLRAGVGGKARAGLVFAGQIAAGQWHAGENAEVLGLADRQGHVLVTAVEAVVDELDRLDMPPG